MLKDFIANLAILMSCFLIIGHVYKGKLVYPKSTISDRVLYGAVLGVVGMILMVYSIRVAPYVVADLRHLVIVLAAIFGGMPAALSSAAIITVGRAVLHGVSSTSLTAAAFSAFIGVGCGLLSYLPLRSWKQLFALNIVGMLIVTLSLYVNIPDKTVLPKLYLTQWTVSMIGGLFAYYGMMYIRRTNRLLVELEESEERYRRLVQLSPDGILVSAGGVITLANEAALAVLGLQTRVKVIGKPLTAFARKEWLNEVSPGTDSAQEPVTVIAETRFQRADGTEVDVETSRTNISYRGTTALLVHFRDITMRKEAEERMKSANRLLQDLSNMDGLTGVANRRCFDETIRQDWEKCRTERIPFSLIMFDLDEFKAFNDTYGHQRGDFCLQEAAKAAKEAVKQPGAIVARYGGEEFAVILPGVDADAAYRSAEEVRAAIQSLHIPHAGSKVSEAVTISVGVSTMTQEAAVTPEELIKAADEALYEAKRAGRNCVRTGALSFSPS